MSNLAETRNINHFMFWEWRGHHVSLPDWSGGTVIFSPPFRDPFNYN